MKALTVKQPWAELIARGEKTIEYRTWSTRYRGPLLITSALKNATTTKAIRALARVADCRPVGVTVCVVELVDVTHSAGSGTFEWLLARPRRVEAMPIKGSQSLWTPDPKLICYTSKDKP
jgi:hypothetical protein